MDPFIDYYAVLGVETHASVDEIRVAFKQLALQYHPDVYKGPDANERMRNLLLAYHTLSDPAERKEYDALRSEHMLDRSGRRVNLYSGGTTNRPSTRNGPTRLHKDPEVSPGARRDRQRYYDFPDLAAHASRTARGSAPAAAQVHLGSVIYNLSQEGVDTLLRDGMLRGAILDTAERSETPGALSSLYVESSESEAQKRYPHYCHRCHHRWFPTPLRSSLDEAKVHTETCPACNATDWNEYLLLRCIHCGAIFESEQLRYEIGSYRYGDDTLCPPYELFPLCPYCGTANWCPAEDERVAALRVKAARRAAIMQVVWISVVVVVVLLLGVMLVSAVR